MTNIASAQAAWDRAAARVAAGRWLIHHPDLSARLGHLEYRWRERCSALCRACDNPVLPAPHERPRRIDWALLSSALASADHQRGLDAAIEAARSAGVTPTRFLLGASLLQGLRWWRHSYRGVPIEVTGRAWWCELETDPDVRMVVRPAVAVAGEEAA